MFDQSVMLKAVGSVCPKTATLLEADPGPAISLASHTGSGFGLIVGQQVIISNGCPGGDFRLDSTYLAGRVKLESFDRSRGRLVLTGDYATVDSRSGHLVDFSGCSGGPG